MSASAGPKSRTSIVPRPGNSSGVERRQVGRRSAHRLGVPRGRLDLGAGRRVGVRVQPAQTVSTFRTVTVNEPFGAS